MNISQLLESLKDPSAVLSIGDKLLAGFSVAILSMSVVFIVLVIIQGIISLLQREKVKQQPTVASVVNTQEVNNEIQDNKELVAVITSAICAATGNKTNNILVRKIVRSNNSKSSWENISKNITK